MDKLEIGRNSKDLGFPQDKSMSGTHARMYVNGKNLRIEDTDSSNG